jgi:hypothetical protein
MNDYGDEVDEYGNEANAGFGGFSLKKKKPAALNNN